MADRGCACVVCAQQGVASLQALTGNDKLLAAERPRAACSLGTSTKPSPSATRWRRGPCRCERRRNPAAKHLSPRPGARATAAAATDPRQQQTPRDSQRPTAAATPPAAPLNSGPQRPAVPRRASPPLPPQINAAPARGPDHFPFQGFRDSGIGSQGIRNSLAMMVKTKSTVVNLDKDSYACG